MGVEVMNSNKRQVMWAKGCSRKEKIKMTRFVAGKLDSIMVGGLSFSLGNRHLDDNLEDDIQINIINCHGEDFKRYFSIPVNKVDEICHTLQRTKKESVLKTNGVVVSPK